MRSNNFDRTAFAYDTLASIVFQGAIKQAQCYFLGTIRPEARVLVMGSGTGWIACEILNITPDANITLVDASQKMSEIARKRSKNRPVSVLCADENQKFAEPFDVIILPFFLDMFSNRKLPIVLEQLSHHSHATTLWLVTDFVSEKWWHRVYLKTMYVFFGVMADLETKSLPDWQNLIQENFTMLNEKEFFSGFIKSKVLQLR